MALRKAPADRRGSLGGSEGAPEENGALAGLVSDLDQQVSGIAAALQTERERQVPVKYGATQSTAAVDLTQHNVV